jgi:Fe2+ or Zn2+ uptake regulation protein
LITIEDNETRYDADVSVHGHFKCEKCNRVTDFSLGLEELIVEELAGFQISQKHVYFKGICDRCLEALH